MNEQGKQVEWKRNESAVNESWEMILGDRKVSGHVSQYGEGSYCAGRWSWGFHRGPMSKGGVVDTRESAMFMAEECHAMSEEAFRRECASKVVDEIHQLQQKLIEMGCANYIPGGDLLYDIGFKEGKADAIARMRQFLEGEEQ